ncbi:DUF2190 family protein [Ancylobacter dichloromethanicus]|uniref:DUF2190 family protein n=1 Tax=Ancylobacter dichloromethanicus TaxID=518825 RepID=A0A9W6J5S7_9HYPH|nr:DUF2190 family protein [Ancylobacter dichloromethanicus]MBS7554162.1 DUF2190 family protein [Ancylobacter dichloromethanicus]GLK71282.1 hypothetical protein GCM10017643_13970 [Ancylobacter dichloromethanicus]
MRNFIQRGDVVTVPAPTGGILSGAGVLVGSLFGIACTTADEGADVEIDTTGVYELAKTSAQAWAVGAKVYFDATNKVATTTASGNSLIGVAMAAAANPSATGRVRLNGVSV